MTDAELDTLSLIVEVAVAIAGFSGVMIALMGGVPERDTVSFVRLWRLLEASLASAFFGMLPIALARIVDVDRDPFLTAAIVFGLYITVPFSTFVRRWLPLLRGLDRGAQMFNGLFLSAHGLLIPMLLAASAGLGPLGSTSAYFLALIFYVSFAGVMFLRFVLGDPE